MAGYDMHETTPRPRKIFLGEPRLIRFRRWLSRFRLLWRPLATGVAIGSGLGLLLSILLYLLVLIVKSLSS